MSGQDGKDAIARRRAARSAFLRELYLEVDGSVSDFVNGYALAERVGIDRPEAAKLFAYFEEKGLVRVDDHREGTLRITADGVDRVETESD